MDFDAVYQAYFKDVYLYLRSLSANADVAEELAQEAFAKALKAIDRFDGRKDVRAWLFTIAKNTYFSYCRRKKLAVQKEAFATPCASAEDFTDAIADEERAFRIHRFLHGMKEPYREVFSLRVFGELSFERIAELFGKSPSWARVTYYRARKQIIQHMEETENG